MGPLPRFLVVSQSKHQAGAGRQLPGRGAGAAVNFVDMFGIIHRVCGRLMWAGAKLARMVTLSCQNSGAHRLALTSSSTAE